MLPSLAVLLSTTSCRPEGASSKNPTSSTITPREADSPPGVGHVGTEPVGLATLESPLIHQIRRCGVVTALGACAAWLIGAVTPGSARRPARGPCAASPASSSHRPPRGDGTAPW